MDLDQLFVHNLRKYRKIRGLSQKSLAERCNAAHSYIRQIESGKGKPSFDFIKKLSSALNIDAYKLFYDETMTKGDKPLQTDGMAAIKESFLTKVEQELDRVIDQLKKQENL
jgi:transcriptional regulator with XRE-family HTH domain